MLSKYIKESFSQSSLFKASITLKLIHVNLRVPIELTTLGDNKYFLLIINDLSKLMWVIMLKRKYDGFNDFKIFKIIIEVEKLHKF